MKNVFLLFGFLLCALAAFAQAPQGINYQAIARDGNGNPKGNKVSVAFRIQDAFGTALYSEIHSDVQPNQFGLFNLVIGKGTSPQGVFANIPWASGPKFLVVSVDGNAGPAQEMQSVPYALYAEKTAADPNDLKKGDAAGGDLSGTYPNPTVDGLQGKPVSATAPQVGQVLQWDGSAWVPKTVASSVPEIYIFEEQYAHGLVPTTGSGGSPVGNAFNTRNLNTQVFPASGGAGTVTVGGNGFLTFKPGTYLIEASAPASFVGRHQLFLRRLDNTIELTGTCEFNAINGGNVSNGTGVDQTRSYIKGIMVVSPGADRVVKLDHYFEFAILPGTTPLGIEHGQAGTIWNTIKEVYATILIQKI